MIKLKVCEKADSALQHYKADLQVPHNLLALDQSSHVTGYAIFQDNKLKTFGHFSLTNDNLDTRLVQFKEEILKLIDKYEISQVIYEDIQLQSNIQNNIQTFKILAEIYGVLSETLEEINIPHESILAASWKKKLNIKGRSRVDQKRNAQQYVVNNYQQKPTQDEADAICIGLSYITQPQDFNWE